MTPTAAILAGLTLGLTSGGYCFWSCASVMGPYMVCTSPQRKGHRWSTVPGAVRALAFYNLGRLLAYLAAGLLVVLISFKYLGDHGFGELVTREHMQDHIDFTEDGRYRLLPTVSHWHRFENFFANWFHIPFLLFAVFALGRNAFRLPRGLVSLMVASLVMYTVADIFVMRFYLPSRYIRRSFPLFAAVVGGIWWARIYHETRARSGTVVPLVWVTVALACLGVTEWGHRFEPGSRTRTYDRHELYDAIRALPGRPMLAAWPKLASELPLMTGKTVLVNQEQAHPWWTDYYAEVTDRTHAFFRAHYTNDPAELRDVIARYGIDYWVLQPRQYRRGYTHKSRKHFEPFATWLREEIATGPNALLNNIPPKYWHWYGGKYRIVASTSVLAWLRETRRVRE